MRRYSESLLLAARAEAQKMLETGEESTLLNLGEQEQALCISTNPEKVLGSESIEVEGKTVYIGIPRKETEK